MGGDKCVAKMQPEAGHTFFPGIRFCKRLYGEQGKWQFQMLLHHLSFSEAHEQERTASACLWQTFLVMAASLRFKRPARGSAAGRN